MPLATVVYHHL